MNVLSPVRRARAALLGAVGMAAALWAAGAGIAPLALAVLLDLVVPLPYDVRRWVVPAAVVVAAVAALVVIWRGRRVGSLERVALFLEERLPELDYALVTAVRPAGATTALAKSMLRRQLERVAVGRALGRPLARAIFLPLALLAPGLAVLALLPAESRARIFEPRPEAVVAVPDAEAPEEELGSRLAPLTVRVAPPRYVGGAPNTLDDPSAVAALPGSRIEIEGRGLSRGAADSIGATIGKAVGNAPGRRLELRADGDAWVVQVTMPVDPAVVHLRDREFDRLLVLEPLADEPPAVILAAPRGDTTLPEPKGRLAIDARMTDDYGLANAQLELLYTSGSGERFETRTTVLRRAALGGRREARLQTTVLLDTMGLRPGDVLHIRAIAHDLNDVTGPGRGESETRTIRIHDPREVPDVNITAASAAAIDTSIISQRMLIMRAESLLARQPQLTPEAYTRESIKLSAQQRALRGRVESIINELENVEGVGFVGETPSSRILRKAAEEMRSAETELSIAQVPMAIVYMRKALAFLEQIREANRYWLRGLLTTTPVDIERVRLTGTDPAQVAPRTARGRYDDPRQALLARLDAAIALVEHDRAAAADSLQRVYASALVLAREAAESIKSAVAAVQGEGDPTAALRAARRRLERRVEATSELTDWYGTP